MFLYLHPSSSKSQLENLQLKIKSWSILKISSLFRAADAKVQVV